MSIGHQDFHYSRKLSGIDVYKLFSPQYIQFSKSSNHFLNSFLSIWERFTYIFKLHCQVGYYMNFKEIFHIKMFGKSLITISEKKI